jgi:hypothetical protein
MFLQDFVRVFIDFNLPFTGHASPFKSQIKPTDPGEQTAKGQFHFFCPNSRAVAVAERLPFAGMVKTPHKARH